MKTDQTGSILRFLDEIEDRDSLDAINAALEKLISGLGFDYYVVACQPKPHKNQRTIELATRLPEGWIDVYINRRYISVDPVLRHLGRAKRGFRMSEALAHPNEDLEWKRMTRMRNEARKYGLEDGYVLPVHGRRGLIGIMAVYGKSVDLPTLDLSLLELAAKRVFWKLVDRLPDRGHAPLDGDTTVSLTRREMETLTYLADGLTSNEISRILGISSNTVDWYMNGIQEKLKARNRHHAVSIALRQGVIF